MDIPTVRKAIKAALQTIEGLNVDDLRENPIPPCAIVYPDAPFDFDIDFDHATRPTFIVLLLVAYVDTTSAQQQLDKYLSTSGPTSVKAAIEADETLGSVVSSAVVTDLKSYAVTQFDSGIKYLSAELGIEVWA